MKVFNLIRKTLNYLSFYWLILRYSLVFYVFFKIGRFPVMSNPHPDAVIPNFKIILQIFYLAPLLILFCIPLNIVHVVRTIYKKSKWVDLSMILLVINIVLFMVINYFDPFGFTEWITF